MRVKFADRREDAGVRGGIRARRAADGRLVDLHDLVNVLDSGDGAMRAGFFHRAVEFRGQSAIENVVDQRGFSGAGDAGDHGHQAERNGDVNILQVVAVRAENGDGFSVGAAACFGYRDFHLAGKILAGERCGIRGDIFGRARSDEIAAGFSRARTKIHHVIRAANRFFVVLDDQHGVAQVAQRFKSGQQAAVVARVQADGRLVQHVKDAAQPRTDLGGQADALRFAAGERGGGTVQSQVAETHVEQKIEALGDFVQRTAGDFDLAHGKLRADFVHGGARLAERQFREIGDRKAGNFYGEAFGAQAAFIAGGAGNRRHVLREPFAVIV